MMAEAVRINAAVWAKELAIATGKNEVRHPGAGIESVTATEASSSGISLDVAAVGGMYADTIQLVGTQKGLGVNHEGIMVADTIELQQDGTICNKGAVMGKTVTVEAESLSNLAGEAGEPSLIAASDSLTIKAGTIENRDGSMLYSKEAMQLSADVMNHKEHAVLRSDGSLHIRAGILRNTSAVIEAAGNMHLTAKELYSI